MLKSKYSKMHGISDIGPNVPAFLIKLWKLVNDSETDEIISWSESNLSFIIHQPARFSRELLPMYYKHNNMASFIRQLNMYGFHKIVSETGGLKNDKNEFAHQCFIKDHPYLLENIKRKLPNPKSGVMGNEQFTSSNIKNATQSDIIGKVLSDINNLKGKQETWDARLASMKRENEALWRELAIFRQKHLKQEQIINRLIHFIVTMVQPSRNVPLRRRYPLMLNDIQPVKKITKLSGAGSANINHGSPTGPTIHEIDSTDVLFGNSEQSGVTSNEDEFASSDLAESPQNLIEVVENSETTVEEPVEKSASASKEVIPEDWLEIEMTDENYIDPLTPIDPAKVNPAVAAATLQHLEVTTKAATPISITIPSVTTATESGKRSVTEKKVIYLTDSSLSQNLLKRKKPVELKLDTNKKHSFSEKNCDFFPSSTSSMLSTVTTTPDAATKSTTSSILNSRDAKSKGKSVMLPPYKRKKNSTPINSTAVVDPKEDLKSKASSKGCIPELEIDDLELLLTSKQLNGDIAEFRGLEGEKNSSKDSFLKLDSLYNGTICEDQLTVDSPRVSSAEPNTDENNMNTLVVGERLSPDALVTEDDFTQKYEVKNTENELNFGPESMAIVCQQPSLTDSLARELNSHVDSMQNEIDYLKEMLKGEGYTFDPNALPWIFNDDTMPYGMLPPLEEEDGQRKNEDSEISGNELMAYGTPNLMDLVDAMGSTGNSQDWTNVFSPGTPVVTDLTTPAPSPSAFAFPSSAKKRKK